MANGLFLTCIYLNVKDTICLSSQRGDATFNLKWWLYKLSKLHDIVLIRKMQKTKRYTFFDVINAIYILDGSKPRQSDNADLQSLYRVLVLKWNFMCKEQYIQSKLLFYAMLIMIFILVATLYYEPFYGAKQVNVQNMR